MILDRIFKQPEVVYVGEESHIRSLVKAASWRATGTADTIFWSWLFTGSVGTALSIGATEVITKIFLYYGHERLWTRIPFGRKKADQPTIEESSTGSVIAVPAPANA